MEILLQDAAPSAGRYAHSSDDSDQGDYDSGSSHFTSNDESQTSSNRSIDSHGTFNLEELSWTDRAEETSYQLYLTWKLMSSQHFRTECQRSGYKWPSEMMVGMCTRTI